MFSEFGNVYMVSFEVIFPSIVFFIITLAVVYFSQDN